MRLLIDGYNLLHATDLFGAGELAGTLRGSREALLGFLADRLSAKERASSVIVFDAKDAPAGLPDRIDWTGMRVRFARGYPDADTLIEEILEGVRGAKQLTVVSGDRRVQRAARSRGARWQDSDAWFADLCRRPAADGPDKQHDPPKRPVGANADWVAEFSDPEALRAIEEQAANTPPPKPLPPANKPEPSASKAKKPRKQRPPMTEPRPKPETPFGAGLLDPFPPGYGEDLLEDPDTPNDASRDGRDG